LEDSTPFAWRHRGDTNGDCQSKEIHSTAAVHFASRVSLTLPKPDARFLELSEE